MKERPHPGPLPPGEGEHTKREPAPRCRGCGSNHLKRIDAGVRWGRGYILCACRACGKQNYRSTKLTQAEADKIEWGDVLVRCAKCGQRMGPYKTKGRVRYLKCNRAGGCGHTDKQVATSYPTARIE